MKRHIVSIAIVLALVVAFSYGVLTDKAFGQNQERAGRTEQRQDMRQRFQNMSPEEREKFRAEMLERRKQWENMSDEDRAKLRDQMRERFGSSSRGMGYEEQLKSIKAIEAQVAKLKAAMEVTAPEYRDKLRELPEEERTKLREKMMTAMMERRTTIRAIEQELAKLKGPGRPPAESEARLNELRAIHKLALREKATQTADRLDKLIVGYQRGSVGGDRPPVRGPREGETRQRRERPERLERQQRERPARQERDVQGESSGKRAPEFELNSFDGKTVSLSDYRGKIVVLEWFNFECPYSLYHYKTKNTMAELAIKYKGKNVVWLAINSTSHTTPEPNKTFAKRHGLPYLILDDRSGKVGRAYGAETTPHMYIINPRGNIVYEGAIDDSPMGRKKEGVINYVDNALAELTTGKAVSTAKTKPYGCTVKYAQ